MYFQSRIWFAKKIVAGVFVIIKIQNESSSVIHYYLREQRGWKGRTPAIGIFSSQKDISLICAWRHFSPEITHFFPRVTLVVSRDTSRVIVAEINQPDWDYDRIAARVAISTRVDGHLTWFFPEIMKTREGANVRSLWFFFSPRLIFNPWS